MDNEFQSKLPIMNKRPATNVLIKPAGPDCNLDCAYCFYKQKTELFLQKPTRMSDEVLETIIRQLMMQPGKFVSLGWQGGEPTIMGIEFYRRAISLMQKYGKDKVVANGFQTNGLLIDQTWARFFKEYHFLIGLSLDGPQHIHDHYRITKNGKGSFQKVVGAADLLLRAGVEVNALTAVNDYSVQFPEEIYSFHKSHGMEYMQFIPCVEPDHLHPDRMLPYSVTARDYGVFLCKLLDLWLQDFKDGRPTTSIRFFESILLKYAGFPPSECTLLPECGSYLVVEHTGDVFACDFFVTEEWKLGNLLEVSIDTLMNSRQQFNFGRLKSKLPLDCLVCKWKKLCRGGCTKDRFLRSDMKKNYLCEGYQVFFSYADEKFKHLRKEWILESLD